MPLGAPNIILKALLPSSILVKWHAHLNLLHLIILGELYKLWSSSLWSLFHSTVILVLYTVLYSHTSQSHFNSLFLYTLYTDCKVQTSLIFRQVAEKFLPTLFTATCFVVSAAKVSCARPLNMCFICRGFLCNTLYHTIIGILIFLLFSFNATVRHCPFVIWKPQILFYNATHGSRRNIHFLGHEFLFTGRISVDSWPNSVNNQWRMNHARPARSFMVTFLQYPKIT